MKRRPRPDTRPDWRDPDMSVLRYMTDTQQTEEFKAEDVSLAHAHNLSISDEPPYYADPTYNLRKRKRNGN